MCDSDTPHVRSEAVSRHPHIAALLVAAALAVAQRGVAGDPSPPPPGGSRSASEAKELEDAIRVTPANAANPATDDQATPQQLVPGLNLLELVVSSRWLLIPIGVVLLLGVATACERLWALRRGRVLPAKLKLELGRLEPGRNRLSPNEAASVCHRYPSVAATIVATALPRIGGSRWELEKALAEVIALERARMYRNVRWLNMAVAVTPVLGLVGVLWGVIDAARQTASLVPAGDGIALLAGGCIVGLLATAAALVVAVPAAAMSNFLEGRIRSSLREVDALLLTVVASD